MLKLKKQQPYCSLQKICDYNNFSHDFIDYVLEVVFTPLYDLEVNFICHIITNKIKSNNIL